MPTPLVFEGQRGRLLRRPSGFAAGEAGDPYYVVSVYTGEPESPYLEFSVRLFDSERGYWLNQSYCSDLGLYDTEFAPEELKNNVWIFFK